MLRKHEINSQDAYVQNEARVVVTFVQCVKIAWAVKMREKHSTSGDVQWVIFNAILAFQNMDLTIIIEFDLRWSSKYSHNVFVIDSRLARIFIQKHICVSDSYASSSRINC